MKHRELGDIYYRRSPMAQEKLEQSLSHGRTGVSIFPTDMHHVGHSYSMLMIALAACDCGGGTIPPLLREIGMRIVFRRNRSGGDESK